VSVASQSDKQFWVTSGCWC